MIEVIPLVWAQSEAARRLMTSGGLSFTTLPVKAFDTVAGQAVNLVDEDEIKKVVYGLLEPDDDSERDSASATVPATLPPATIDITNAAGRDGPAATLTKAFIRAGPNPKAV